MIKAPDGPLAVQGYVSATGGNLRVHFENDRGLCYFALGPATKNDPCAACMKLLAGSLEFA